MVTPITFYKLSSVSFLVSSQSRRLVRCPPPSSTLFRLLPPTTPARSPVAAAAAPWRPSAREHCPPDSCLVYSGYLRSLARRGATASQVLRALKGRLAKEPHKLVLLKYMRESFALTLQEASPIAGWSAAGNGDLSDAQIDDFVGPEMRRHQAEWDRGEETGPQLVCG